jgi:hypothetical protein
MTTYEGSRQQHDNRNKKVEELVGLLKNQNSAHGYSEGSEVPKETQDELWEEVFMDWYDIPVEELKAKYIITRR